MTATRITPGSLDLVVVPGSATYSCAANANATVSVDFAVPAGYQLIIAWPQATGSSNVILRSFMRSSNTRWNFYIRNLGSTALSDITFQARGLYAKVV